MEILIPAAPHVAPHSLAVAPSLGGWCLVVCMVVMVVGMVVEQCISTTILVAILVFALTVVTLVVPVVWVVLVLGANISRCDKHGLAVQGICSGLTCNPTRCTSAHSMALHCNRCVFIWPLILRPTALTQDYHHHHRYHMHRCHLAMVTASRIP